jgi:hypothetical protein
MDGFQFAVKIIAVVFGVLGGGFIGNIIAPWVARTRKGQSGTLLGGAVLGGAIMWMAMSFSGGGGFGFGGGGKGVGTGTGKNHTDKDKNGGVVKDGKEKDGKAVVAAPKSIEIDVLGGERVRDQRFYVLGPGKPMTQSELEKAILEKKHQNPALKDVEIRLYTDSVAKDSEAVTGLEEWATKQGFAPTVKLMATPAP